MDPTIGRPGTATAPGTDQERVAPKCCPFCLSETLIASWDSVDRRTRFQCCTCFEAFGRLPRPFTESADRAAAAVVNIGDYRRPRDAGRSRSR